MFDAKVDVKQLAGLIDERNQLFSACKRALGALNTVACIDTQIGDMLRDDIAELEKIVAVSEVIGDMLRDDVAELEKIVKLCRRQNGGMSDEEETRIS